MLIILVACEDKPFPTANLNIPSELRQRYDDDARNLIVYDNNVVLSGRDREAHDDRIAILEAHMQGDTYVATKLARAWLDDSGWETEPLTGTLTFTAEQLTVEVQGALATIWNGEYEARELRERREREARAAERAANGEPPPVVERSACQAYRDCTCALSQLAVASGDNPFVAGCAEADRLLRTAPDDAEECRTGLIMQRQLAPGLGLTLPAACN